MLSAVIAQGLFKLTLAILGIIIGRLTLTLMDRKLKHSDLGKWLGAANERSKAIYYSARIVSVMLVVGLVLS